MLQKTKKIFLFLLFSFLIFPFSLLNIAHAENNFSLTVHAIDSNNVNLDKQFSELENTTIYVGVGWGGTGTSGETLFPNKNIAKLTANGATINLQKHPYDIWSNGDWYYGKFDLKLCKECTKSTENGTETSTCDQKVDLIHECPENRPISNYYGEQYAEGFSVSKNNNNAICYTATDVACDYLVYDDFTSKKVKSYTSGTIDFPIPNYLYEQNLASEGELIIQLKPQVVIEKNDDNYQKIFSRIGTEEFTIKVSDNDNKLIQQNNYSIATKYDVSNGRGQTTVTNTYPSFNIIHNFFEGTPNTLDSIEVTIELINQNNEVKHNEFVSIKRNQKSTNTTIDLMSLSATPESIVKKANINVTSREKGRTMTAFSQIAFTHNKYDGKTDKSSFNITNDFRSRDFSITENESIEFCISSAKGNPENQNKEYKLPQEKCKKVSFAELVANTSTGVDIANQEIAFELVDINSTEESTISTKTTSTTSGTTTGTQTQSNTTTTGTPTTQIGGFQWFNYFQKPVEVTAQAPFFNEEGKKYKSLGDYLTDFYLFALWLIAAISVIMIIVGGYTIITSSGNPEGVTKGRGMITSALIALGLLVLAFVVLRIISPQTLSGTLPDAGTGLQDAQENALKPGSGTGSSSSNGTSTSESDTNTDDSPDLDRRGPRADDVIFDREPVVYTEI